MHLENYNMNRTEPLYNPLNSSPSHKISNQTTNFHQFQPSVRIMAFNSGSPKNIKFTSRCFLDVRKDTRIIAVCGIKDPKAGPEDDGWFFPDFFLFHRLLGSRSNLKSSVVFSLHFLRFITNFLKITSILWAVSNNFILLKELRYKKKDWQGLNWSNQN